MKTKKRIAADQRKPKEYEFTLVLAGLLFDSAQDQATPAHTIDSGQLQKLENALYEAGCDDATSSIRYGRGLLHFARKAASFKAAILSAVCDVNKAQLGLEIIRVFDHPFMTQSDIADQVGKSRQIVQQYIIGTKGPGGFPPPIGDLMDGTPLWSWVDVVQWLNKHQLISDQVVVEAKVLAVINSILELWHQIRQDEASVDEIWKSLEANKWI